MYIGLYGMPYLYKDFRASFIFMAKINYKIGLLLIYKKEINLSCMKQFICEGAIFHQLLLDI